MASYLLFATCPKSIPNGALLSKLATDSGTFKLLGKAGGTYILGHEDCYISVVDKDSSLSALHLTNQTTLKATRIVGKFNASRSFTVEFQVNDPSFLNTASVFTLTEEQFKVLGVDYTTQLNNDFIANRRDCSTGQKRKICADEDSTANSLDHGQKRQNVQEISLPPPPLPFFSFGISVPFNCAVPEMRDYTSQRKPNLPVTPSPVPSNMTDTVLPTPIQSDCPGPCVFPPKARDLRALSFQPNLDTYTISYRVKSNGKKIEKQATTLEITNFPGGLAAIEDYKKLYEPKLKKLPVPALIQAPAPVPYLAPTLSPPSVAAVQPHYSCRFVFLVEFQPVYRFVFLVEFQPVYEFCRKLRRAFLSCLTEFSCLTYPCPVTPIISSC